MEIHLLSTTYRNFPLYMSLFSLHSAYGAVMLSHQSVCSEESCFLSVIEVRGYWTAILFLLIFDRALPSRVEVKVTSLSLVYDFVRSSV